MRTHFNGLDSRRWAGCRSVYMWLARPLSFAVYCWSVDKAIYKQLTFVTYKAVYRPGSKCKARGLAAQLASSISAPSSIVLPPVPLPVRESRKIFRNYGCSASCRAPSPNPPRLTIRSLFSPPPPQPHLRRLLMLASALLPDRPIVDGWILLFPTDEDYSAECTDRRRLAAAGEGVWRPRYAPDGRHGGWTASAGRLGRSTAGHRRCRGWCRIGTIAAGDCSTSGCDNRRKSRSKSERHRIRRNIRDRSLQ